MNAADAKIEILLLNLLSGFRGLCALRYALQDNEMDELRTCIKKFLSLKSSSAGDSISSASSAKNGMKVGANLKLIFTKCIAFLIIAKSNKYDYYFS